MDSINSRIANELGVRPQRRPLTGNRLRSAVAVPL
jgi:hypothetical protein